jgi:DNA-binding IclR family transcriptional regulator
MKRDSADAARVTPQDKAGVQVIARAAAILRRIAEHPAGLSLGDLARDLGLAKSTVQRIVGALVREQLLIPPSTRAGARIGAGIVKLAAAADFDVVRSLRPQVLWLAEETGETVDVSILDGGSAVFVDQIPGRHRLRAVSAIGERFPLTNTAPGIMLLALSDPKTATQCLSRSLIEHPKAAIDDLEAFWTTVATARRQGYAIDEEQHAEGICAVGVGLLDPLGRPVAISIPVPASRFLKAKQAVLKTIISLRDTLAGTFTRS